jgi:ATP-dependent Clp protease ATP-binding subunit ClpC
VIVFKALSREDLVTIVDYELRKVRQRLADEHHLEIDLTEDARQFLIERGYNPDFGARPLRRAIEQYVEDPISEEVLRGAYKNAAKIVVSLATAAEGTEPHLRFTPTGQKAAPGGKLQEVHEGT